MEPKFKIGDRVKVKAHGSVADGMTGTVLESDRMPYIRFDVKSDGLHNCNGLCEDGYGYAINQSKLTKIRSKKQETTETMKAKFKVGQTVIVSKKPIDKSGKPHWVKSMDCTKGKVGVVSNVFEGLSGWYVNITGDNFHGGYSYHQDWLKLVRFDSDTTTETTGITIPVSELKRIHDVACGEWKLKIQSMVTPFQDEVFVSNERIEEMLKAATSTQKPVVEDVFKTYVRESKPEFFNFGSEYTLNLTSIRKPIYIRHGLANDGYEGREIGFSSDYTTILVDEKGNETELISSHYLKFKIKK
jgi:ribosomal protein L21E